MRSTQETNHGAQPERSNLLADITGLSHRYGTADYVCGGGGNTSAKNKNILWVKPSGTTLAGLSPDKFLPLNRAKLGRLYNLDPPEEPAAREELVKNMMAEAVVPGASGRASVEAPLHDSLNAIFVVHTHPALINGMTCAKDGAKVCKSLFPGALWLDYIDPGYTLCMRVRKEIQAYQAEHGQQPEIIFLKNHGVFVSADTVEEMDKLYSRIMNTLAAEYAAASVSTELEIAPTPDPGLVAAAQDLIKEGMQNPDLCFAVSGTFAYANVPLTPDHTVYSKSYFLTERPTRQSVGAFIERHGYPPRVIAWDSMVFGVEASQKSADLALELAQNGALVQQLTGAFAGLDPMTDRAREFIENWEVESYRQKQLK